MSRLCWKLVSQVGLRFNTLSTRAAVVLLRRRAGRLTFRQLPDLPLKALARHQHGFICNDRQRRLQAVEHRPSVVPSPTGAPGTLLCTCLGRFGRPLLRLLQLLLHVLPLLQTAVLLSLCRWLVMLLRLLLLDGQHLSLTGLLLKLAASCCLNI